MSATPRACPTVIAVVTFVVLFLMTGSVVAPVRATVLNLLSLTVMFGVLGYILRVHPSWMKFIELGQTLGKPLVMRLNLNQQSSGASWETHKMLMQTTSPIVDCGVHYVDVMCRMTGARPIRVSGIGARFVHLVAADHAACTIDLVAVGGVAAQPRLHIDDAVDELFVFPAERCSNYFKSKSIFIKPEHSIHIVHMHSNVVYASYHDSLSLCFFRVTASLLIWVNVDKWACRSSQMAMRLRSF